MSHSDPWGLWNLILSSGLALRSYKRNPRKFFSCTLATLSLPQNLVLAVLECMKDLSCKLIDDDGINDFYRTHIDGLSRFDSFLQRFFIEEDTNVVEISQQPLEILHKIALVSKDVETLVSLPIWASCVEGPESKSEVLIKGYYTNETTAIRESLWLYQL